jgi:hypothetical protein
VSNAIGGNVAGDADKVIYRLCLIDDSVKCYRCGNGATGTIGWGAAHELRSSRLRLGGWMGHNI